MPLIPSALIGELTAATRTAIPFITTLASIGVEGLSSNYAEDFFSTSIETITPLTKETIYGALRDYGVGARESDVSKIIDAVRGTAPSANYIRHLAGNYIPRADKVAVKPNRQHKAYMYSVEVKGVDTETGDFVKRTYNWTSDTLISKNKVYDGLTSWMLEHENDYPIDITGMSATQLTKASWS